MASSADRLQLLPAVFTNHGRKVEVNSVFIKLKSKKSGPCRVKCYIDWTEDLKKIETKDPTTVETVTKTTSTVVSGSDVPQKPSKVSSSTKKKSTCRSKKSRKKSTRSSKKSKRSKTSEECTCETPKTADVVKRECEGICGREMPVKQLFLIGQCEHAVCSRCLENAPRIENCFDVLGCPNPKCYQLDVAALCPDKAKRIAQIRKAYSMHSTSRRSSASASTKSNTSSQSGSETQPQSPVVPPSTSDSITYENINATGRAKTPEERAHAKKIAHSITVTLAVFRDSNDGSAFLQKIFHELPSTISVGAALKSCISESAELSSHDLSRRCYVGPNSFIKVLDRLTWNTITLDDDEPLYKLEDDEMRVMLVIDLVGLGPYKSKRKRHRKQ